MNRISILVLAVALFVPAAVHAQSNDAGPCAVCSGAPAPAAVPALQLQHEAAALEGALRTPTLSDAGKGANPWLIAGGAVLGGAVGGAIGCAINSDDYGVYCGGQSDTTVFVSAAIGAAIGGFAVWLLTRD